MENNQLQSFGPLQKLIEDDSSEESEDDVETFWDKHEDESGEESLDHAAKKGIRV
jgi:hypothetical protein